MAHWLPPLSPGRGGEGTKTQSNRLHVVRIMGWERADTFFSGCLLYPAWWPYNLLSKLGRFGKRKGSAINNDTRETGVTGDIWFPLFIARHGPVRSLEHVMGDDVRQATEPPGGAKRPPTQTLLCRQVSAASTHRPGGEAGFWHTRPLLRSELGKGGRTRHRR